MHGPPQRFRHATDNTAMLFQAKCRLLEVPPLPASTKGLRVYDEPVQQAKKVPVGSRTDSLDDVMPALDF